METIKLRKITSLWIITVLFLFIVNIVLGILSCNYNPETGKNTPRLGLLFLALPVIIALLLLLGISYSVRHKQI